MGKQLDINKDYNKLLQKTVNSLRHSQNIYSLHKQWIEIKRELKPLPSFDSMTDEEYKRYVEKQQHLQYKESINKMKREQERDKMVNKQKKFTDVMDYSDDDMDDTKEIEEEEEEENESE